MRLLTISTPENSISDYDYIFMWYVEKKSRLLSPQAYGQHAFETMGINFYLLTLIQLNQHDIINNWTVITCSWLNL